MLDAGKILSLLPLQPNQVVADIGCGDGLFALLFAEWLSRGYVFAIDVDEEKLDALRTKAIAKGISNLELIQGSQTDIHLERASLDGVFLSRTLHEVQDWRTFLQLVKQLVVPGGWLAILEYVKKRKYRRGPPLAKRIDSEELSKLVDKIGLTVIQEIAIDKDFYMLVLKNPD